MLALSAISLLAVILCALAPGSTSQGIQNGGQKHELRQNGGQQYTIRRGQPHVLAVHSSPTQYKRAIQQQHHVVQNHHQVPQHNPKPTLQQFSQHNPIPSQHQYAQSNTNPSPNQHSQNQPNLQYHLQQLSPEHQYLMNRYYREYLRNAFYNPFQQPQYRQLFVPYNHNVASQQYFSRTGPLLENSVGGEAPYDPTGHGDPAFSFYQQE